jgi:hypothetical protein
MPTGGQTIERGVKLLPLVVYVILKKVMAFANTQEGIAFSLVQ